jgi:hypothetical protein
MHALIGVVLLEPTPTKKLGIATVAPCEYFWASQASSSHRVAFMFFSMSPHTARERISTGCLRDTLLSELRGKSTVLWQYCATSKLNLCTIIAALNACAKKLCPNLFCKRNSANMSPTFKDAASTYTSENLSMVTEGGFVPKYSGHQPAYGSVVGQRQSAATAHMVRASRILDR